jgi:phosphoribosylanthranilate isomerase
MLKVKICGLKFPHNISQLIEVKPDYMGFIFYPKSKRYCEGFFDVEFMETIPTSIKKVGIFVNEDIKTILAVSKKYGLNLIQLHGAEKPEICAQLKDAGKIIIKAFQIDKHFNFMQLELFNLFCDYYLFDTKGPTYGGSGKSFDWNLLDKYNNERPFFLSGGIDFIHLDKIREMKHLNLHAVDINSKFETSPGMKNVEKAAEFVKLIRSIDL